MERIYIKNLNQKVGEEVLIKGWVNVRRDQGKMVFMDMRDFSGLVQCVVLPNSLAIDIAKEVRTEWVLSVKGKVNKRPEKNIVAEKVNGDIEIEVLDIEVLNKSETLPFDVTEDTSAVSEDLRLKYRYLDLRSQRMQKNIRMRDRIITFLGIICTKMILSK